MQEAIRAGYSKKSAYSIGEENLRKPEIAQAIANQQKASIATNIDVEAPPLPGQATPAGNAMLAHQAIDLTLISAASQ